MPPEQALWEHPAGTGLFQAVGARGPALHQRNSFRVFNISVFKPWCHKRREEKGPTYLESVLEVFQAVLQVPHGSLFQHGEFVSRALGARAPPLRPLQHASSPHVLHAGVSNNESFPNYFKLNVVVSCSFRVRFPFYSFFHFYPLIKTPSHLAVLQGGKDVAEGAKRKVAVKSR